MSPRNHSSEPADEGEEEQFSSVDSFDLILKNDFSLTNQDLLKTATISAEESKDEFNRKVFEYKDKDLMSDGLIDFENNLKQCGLLDKRTQKNNEIW